MRWGDKYLYIGAFLQETDVWANQTKHNSVGNYWQLLYFLFFNKLLLNIIQRPGQRRSGEDEISNSHYCLA